MRVPPPSPEPGPANDHLAGHVRLLCRSFHRWTGGDLVAPDMAPADAAAALYHAPFVVLSHDAGTDPRFTYANRAAQGLFEMSWADLVGLPSRLSAESPARAERERLLARVAAHGYIDDYEGVRVSATGRRFRIRGAVVWELIDDAGQRVGQAACFAEIEPLEAGVGGGLPPPE